MSATTRLDWYGSRTSWTTSPPTFSVSGGPTADGAWSVGPLTVESDGHAWADVTTGPTAGAITWTDSTTGATATQDVGSAVSSPSFVLLLDPAPRRRGR